MSSYVDGKDKKERLLEKQLSAINENNDLLKENSINDKKISRKDKINYGIQIFAIVVAICLGIKSQSLERNKKQINNYIQIIQKNNSYDGLPESIRENIEKIAEASGPTVRTVIGNEK